MKWPRLDLLPFTLRVLMIVMFAMGTFGCLSDNRTCVSPQEDENAILRNPDMGWVLLENYPLDQSPNGSSTLVTLPDDNFPDLDYVALMFSWADIEISEGVYDFTRVNYAYDYWKARGKRIHLRMSAEDLLWWPDSGLGVPQYILDKLLPEQKQTRHAMGLDYTVVDSRNPHYLDRLRAFLQAVNENFSGERAVELIDLRGFGLWGEWHSGFQYPSLEVRREVLCNIIDTYSEAFPDHRLALSYSYDPDSPPELWSGTTTAYDPNETGHYKDYVQFSAFDHALTKPNITFRRDGCGGTVHSNERKFAEAAFTCQQKGPFTSEFFDGYKFFNGGDPWWSADRALDDALSLHPNFIVVLGWQTYEAKQFVQERPDLVARGLLNMGYRLVPTAISWPKQIQTNHLFTLRTQWVNRGSGRAVVDYDLELILKDASGKIVFDHKAGNLSTSHWGKGKTYEITHEIPANSIPPGEYLLYLALLDPRTDQRIQLPLVNEETGAYRIGTFAVTGAEQGT